MLRKKSFKISVFAGNFAKYPDVLSGLPESMINLLNKAHTCKNMTDPGKCMDKCIGYDFHIGDTHYQKCRFGCFQFNVDSESIPFLLEMIKSELEARRAA